MKINPIKITVLALTLIMSLASFQLQAAATQYAHEQQTADGYYANKDYPQAYKHYLKLAKKGDSFAQYRVSYMFLEGQGQKTDVIEAFAWAVLAAEDGQKDLVQYRTAVAALVPVEKQRKAERKADYYTRKWGNLALADSATRRAKKQLRECTGSRLGTRCEEVYAMDMPKFWGINPGNGGGSAGDGGGVTKSGAIASGTGTAAGGPTQDVAYYQAVRAQIRALDQYIQENSGTVELREFEVIEPEKSPAENTENSEQGSG